MQLFDPTAVAALLGLHPRTIVLYFRAGKIPGAFQVGGKHWRISREDLETYLKARPRTANQAMSHLADNKAMSHLDPSVVYYGPHPCRHCGQMIVKIAEEAGGSAFDAPMGPVYPNTVWPPHVCDPKARATYSEEDQCSTVGPAPFNSDKVNENSLWGRPPGPVVEPKPTELRFTRPQNVTIIITP